ncbi:MAG TPA: LLM class flavin-dependent oxidoreductase [Acetobacteraceae bacterium]|jgi:FMN-dependent oxidoreductase (nitrilotriacetate monooxygenase family)|nr:LLM class flavin-dependent oxidoreductase [Acetobacteraceae bacterium]
MPRETRREIRLNAFDMNCVGHIQHGMWAHPRDRSMHYTDLDHWVSLAQTLERGLFDGLFLADILGVYDVFQGQPDASIRNAVQIPVNDPLLLVPAMAYATRHLGFGVTCNLTYEPPYIFARRMSTLDHLTRGRIGWNVVTGYLDSAARGMGLAQQPEHDSRYELAEEYMQVVYQLWEGSWEDAAVLRDRDTRRFADPSRIHRVRHQGQHYKLDAIHLSEPSPQRTPVLYQAGASERGRAFAAQHAECIFVNGQFRHNVREIVADIRTRAKAAGRDPYDIKFFVGATVVVAPTEAEAQDKLTEYREYASSEGALAHYSASVGVDFSRYGPDEPIRFVQTNALRSNLEAITVRSQGTEWTTRKLLQMMVLGSRQAPIVGSPATVADQLQAWVNEADVDGFNLSRTVIPECVEDFVALVVPELQSRGVMKRAYQEGALREKLFGAGPRLPASHPAACWRR